MKIKKWALLLWLTLAALHFSSCDENKWDAPAGNQKNDPIPVPEDVSAKLLARYTFESDLIDEINGAVGERAGNLPSFEMNEERGGTVLHQLQGDGGSESYVQFPNPLYGIENLYGFSISLWINRQTDDVWNAVWGFIGDNGRFYLTPNAYVGYNGTGGYFDVNLPDLDRGGIITNAIALHEWAMVTVTVDMDGFAIYLDGKLTYDNNNHGTWHDDAGQGPNGFSYDALLGVLASYENFYLGYGSWWGSAELLIDDLLIYQNVLTASEVSALYDSYSGLVAYYNFEANLTNVVNSAQTGELLFNGGNQQPDYMDDNSWSSIYLRHYIGWLDNESYVKIPNPLKGVETSGATISLWINLLGDATYFETIWGFRDDDNSDGIDGRLYLSGRNPYIGYNGTSNNHWTFFDLNHFGDGAVIDGIPLEKWTMTTVVFTDSGCRVYIDGKELYTNLTNTTWNDEHGDGAGGFDFTKTMDIIYSSENFYIGYGSWWGTQPMCTDNLMIYSRGLSGGEIEALYEANKPN